MFVILSVQYPLTTRGIIDLKYFHNPMNMNGEVRKIIAAIYLF